MKKKIDNSDSFCYIFSAMPKMKSQGQSVFLQEEIAPGILKIRLSDSVDANTLVKDIDTFFDKLIASRHINLVFDIGNIGFPSGSFIAVLVAKTMRARRAGGDIKIINMSDSARNNLAIFTPLTYLSIGTDELSVLNEEFGVFTRSRQEYEAFDEGDRVRLAIESDVEDLNRVNQFIMTYGERAGLDSLEISKLKIAVYEACMNVIEHAYEYDPHQEIRVELQKIGHRLRITIIDKGIPFDIYNLKPYDVDAAFEERREGGFGLYIIQRSVDEIMYQSDPGTENRLTLIKLISGAHEASS